MISTLVLFWFWRPSYTCCFLLMIFLIVDGMIQQCTSYESNNIKRCISGFLFGIGLCGIIAQSTLDIFSYGVELGMMLKK